MKKIHKFPSQLHFKIERQFSPSQTENIQERRVRVQNPEGKG
jgi:hypothetical protein